MLFFFKKSIKSTQAGSLKGVDTYMKESRRTEERGKDSMLAACMTLESYL